jgi:hypothetical protein
VPSKKTRRALPLILIRGFGGIGVEDEKKLAYQGFNDGTVYPGKRGENYIYEGMILRFMKSSWEYHDATNVVGYYADSVPLMTDAQKDAWLSDPLVKNINKAYFSGGRVVLDPAMAAYLLRTIKDPLSTLWVFRYYDLNDRRFKIYGETLVTLIDFIRDLAAKAGEDGTPMEKPLVNIIAHSMGGLIVREAIQRTYPLSNRTAQDYINKVVTLGTPHQGIAFQVFEHWAGISAAEEINHFSPALQKDPNNDAGFAKLKDYFPLDRLLTVVGTNYRTYDVGPASVANRLFSLEGESGMTYNRSDGLVKQTFAQIPGAPRTFVHKCHGGFDSLITARESFEIATRFFFGDTYARLRLIKAKITRGKDWFGKSEFFFGVSIKPRRVDFDLFHQSSEAENCYGPFASDDLTDGDVAFPWVDGKAGKRIIWEGWFDTSKVLKPESDKETSSSASPKDLVMRLDFYVGERDTFGIGFSDNVIFRKQYYVRAELPEGGRPLALFAHTGENFADPASTEIMQNTPDGWIFHAKGTGFEATLAVEFEAVAQDG